jgi:hypothetical protein
MAAGWRHDLRRSGGTGTVRIQAEDFDISAEIAR